MSNKMQVIKNLQMKIEIWESKRISLLEDQSKFIKLYGIILIESKWDSLAFDPD